MKILQCTPASPQSHEKSEGLKNLYNLTEIALDFVGPVHLWNRFKALSLLLFILAKKPIFHFENKNTPVAINQTEKSDYLT